MDETVDVPDPAAIRRALAECMTLADIDDAMGWEPGTARRRRWRNRSAGGLPPVDAELAGVPLWFRSTIIRWQAELHAPQASPPDGGVARPEESSEPAPPAQEAPEAEHRPAAHEDGAEEREDGRDDTDASDTDAGETDAGTAPRAGGTDHLVGDQVRDGDRETAEIRSPPAEPAEPSAPGAPPRTEPTSGFQLEPGQDVFAFVHREWKPAVVRARDRRTVVVDYQLHPGPLGARRQRVTLDRIRLPDPDS